MPESIKLLEEDARVVRDVLAFIDAFYASSSNEGVHLKTYDVLHDGNIPPGSLQQTLDVVERQIAETAMVQSRSGDNGNDAGAGDSITDLDELQSIVRRLHHCQSLWREVFGRPRTIRITILKEPSMAIFVRQRFDEFVSRVASRSIERPHPADRVVEDVSEQYFAQRTDGVAIRFRVGRDVPFKLSILASALWSVVVDASFDQSGACEAGSYQHLNQLELLVRDERAGTNAQVLMRRLHLPDGSILLCWTVFSPACPDPSCQADNPAADLETQEFGWTRVGRTTSSPSGRPRVYLESVSDVLAQLPQGDTLGANPATYRRYEQFTAFMTELSSKATDRNQRQLENRMLNATLPSSRPRNVSSLSSVS